MTLDPVKLSEKSQLSAATLAAGDRFVALDVSAGELKTIAKSELESAIGSPTVTANRALVSDGSGNLAPSDVTATELGYLDGVTSNVQTQLDGKQAAGSYAAATHSHAIADVTNLQTTLDGKASTGSVAAVSAALSVAEADIDTLETSVAGKQASNANLTALAGLTGAADRVPYFTALATLALAVLTSFGRSLIAAADAAGVRSLLGLGTAAQSNTGDFAASSHTHAQSDVTDLTTDLAAKAALAAVPILAPGTSARNVIQPTGAGIVAAVLKWFNSSHSADLLQCVKQDDTVLLKITAGGAIIGSAVVPSANYQPLFQLTAAGVQAGNFAVNGGDSGVDIISYGRLALNDGSTVSGRQLLVRPGTAGGIYLGNAGQMIRWGDTYTTSDWDTAIGRNAAGVVEVNSGTAGVFRDLAARHLLSSDFVRLASPVTTNSSTLYEALTGLSQTLTAGKTYAGRLVLIASCPTPGDGVRVDFDGGTATFYNAHAALTGNVQGATVTTSRYAGGGSSIDLYSFADDGRHYLVYDVTMSVNAGGTFIPRFSKASDATGDNLTIHDGSYFDLREVR
jgi:hypothetical protein